jgi:hypothetical protein
LASVGLLVSVSASGCEQLIGADFGDFEVVRDAGSALRDAEVRSDAPDGARDAMRTDSGNGSGIDADGSTPMPEGGGSRCVPGDINDIANCINCGRYVQICNTEGAWDPPFCQQPPGACPPGSTEHRLCEGDGTQTATCTTACTWVLDTCVHSTCTPNQIDQQACGACGTQTRTCQAADGGWHWTPFSACTDEKACAPNQIDREACGRCGTHSRVCSTQCAWGSWEICQNEGECAPGDTQERGCVIGLLKQTRTCSDRCVWGDWIGLCL